MKISYNNSLILTLFKGIEADEDSYERKVLAFFEDYSKDGIFNAEIFANKLQLMREQAKSDGDTSALNLIRDRLRELMKTADKELARKYVRSGRWQVAKLIGFFILVTAVTSVLYLMRGDIYPVLFSALSASITLLIISIPPIFVPSALFGRWMQDYYEEKLEWDAFRNFLSDFASIQKYAPEHIAIWKEWLVYGTALGVGDSVVKAMEQLKVPNLPEINAATYMPVHFDHAYRTASWPVIKESKESSWFSGGGSFGGGDLEEGEASVVEVVEMGEPADN